MSSIPSDAAKPAPSPAVPERRRNAALRQLIDEMLFQVRGMQAENTTAWTAEERARAEAELDRIMLRVRSAALPRPGSDSTP
jgi:hypothetical protein